MLDQRRLLCKTLSTLLTLKGSLACWRMFRQYMRPEIVLAIAGRIITPRVRTMPLYTVDLGSSVMLSTLPHLILHIFCNGFIWDPLPLF